MIHSFDGEFTANYKTGKLSKLKSGGHGQSCIDLMDKNGLKYKITKTYPNGVRVVMSMITKIREKDPVTTNHGSLKIGLKKIWFELVNMLVN